MRKLWKLGLAVALMTAAVLSTPPEVSADIGEWCIRCSDSGACHACCRCEGYPIGYCAGVC